jgi:hypothetical protein
MEEKKLPTTEEIDTLAQMYVDGQASADHAQGIADAFGDQLIMMTQEFGSISPRAEKTRQLEGSEWIVKVTQGQSVHVKASQVVRLRRFLAGKGKSRLFGKLFTTEERYSLSSEAHTVVNGKAFLAGLPASMLSKVSR